MNGRFFRHAVQRTAQIAVIAAIVAFGKRTGGGYSLFPNSYGAYLSDSIGYAGEAGVYTDRPYFNSTIDVDSRLLMGYRYYSPYSRRFTTRDPIGYDGGANLYAYCEGSGLGVTYIQFSSSSTTRSTRPAATASLLW